MLILYILSDTLSVISHACFKLSSIVPATITPEINLSEKKLRLYWDRTRDIPAKAVLTLSDIRYDPNTPPNVLKYVKDELYKLRRVFESNTKGILLCVKDDPIKINLIPNAKP